MSQPRIVSREVFLSFLPRIKEVALPNDAGIVKVRELRASEAIDFAKTQASDPSGAIYNIVQWAVVDDDSQPVFTSSDKTAIAGLPYNVIDTLANAILEFSGLKEDAKKKQQSPKPDDAK